MNAPGWRLRAGAVVIALVLWGGSAAGDASPEHVDIFVAGPSEDVARLESAIGVADRPIRWVPIGRVDVDDVMRPPAAGGGAQAARAWIDCSNPVRMRIYFANWNAERFLLREVPLPDGLNELALETLGQVIASSLSALMTDAHAGMSRAEITSVLQPETAKPEPEPEPAPGPPLTATWSLFYAMQTFAPEQSIEHGPGLLATLGPRVDGWRPGVWISAQYQLPETIDTGLIGVRLDTVALRAGVQMARPLGSRVSMALRAGLGGDVIHIAPRKGSSDPPTTLSPDRFSWGYAAQVALASTIRLDAGFALCLALIADVDLDMRHYDVMVDGAAMRAVTPWWVRPGLMAGVTWP
ncbi:MAG: hypothetical protein WBY94_24525 [Polyangiaceae bacterium]